MPPLPSYVLTIGIFSLLLVLFLRRFSALADVASHSPKRMDYPFSCSVCAPDGTQYSYRFRVVADSATHRVLIEHAPPYLARDDDPHVTHRLLLGGKQYVCWDSPILTSESAERVAALWASKTTDYIRTGQRF